MAEIDYVKEKCWQIKEQRPIEVTKSKKCEDRWKIKIKSMIMRYDTYSEILSSSNNWKYAEYDYENGEGLIIITDEGLKELEQMKDIITIK